MRRCSIFVSLLLLQVLTLHAQQEVVFKVAKRKMNLSPDLPILVYNRNYVFTLKGIDPTEILRIDFDAGKITRKDSVLKIWVYPNLAAGNGKGILQIFGTNANKEIKIYEKKFNLLDTFEIPKFRPSPMPMQSQVNIVCWGRNLRPRDTIGKKALLSFPFLYPINPNRLDMNYNITSFGMSCSCDTARTFTTSGSQFTTEMKRMFVNIKPGCKITLRDIHYIGSRADERIAGPFELVVKDDR